MCFKIFMSDHRSSTVRNIFCVPAAPVIISGSIRYANLDSLVTTPHPEIIPCSNQFSMIVETLNLVLVTINKRVSQIARRMTRIQTYEKSRR